MEKQSTDDGPRTHLALHSFTIHLHGCSNSVQEFLNFFSATVANRTQAGQRQSIQEQNYTFHVYCIPNSGDLTAVMVTDDEYPVRVAFSVLNKITDEFQQSFPKEKYEADVNNARLANRNNPKLARELDWPTLSTYLQKYQDPKQADTIMRVQQELDETKFVLVRVASCVVVHERPGYGNCPRAPHQQER